MQVFEEKADRTRLDRTISGLCTTCSHVTDCSYLREFGSAIVHCGEFDEVDEKPPEPFIRRPHTALSTVAGTDTGARTQGLCINCDHRHTCIFKVPESGIWHCAEYS